MRLAVVGMAALLALAGCGGGPPEVVPTTVTAAEVEARLLSLEVRRCWAYDEGFSNMNTSEPVVAEQGGRRVIDYVRRGAGFGRAPVILTVEPRDGEMVVSGSALGFEDARGRILRDLARWGAGEAGCGPEHVPMVL